MTPEKRTQMMLNAPVSHVIPRLAVPTIISMLITAVYNMADTFFVSQLGTSASGAVGVIFSAMAIIQAVAFMMGMGTGTNVSQALGAGDEERARRYASVGFFSAFIMGVVIAVLALSNIDWLVRFLGATETIAPYAKDYATYIFYAAPFMMCSFVMNNLLRFEGLATYGMIGITTGGILNMLLDPLFIFGFGMGTAGAAIATAISQCVSFTILLIMCNTKPDAITIHPKHFRPTLSMFSRIIYIGFPSLGRQGIASVSTILLNTTAGVHGDAAIAAMSIVAKVIGFSQSISNGIGQGAQTIFSYNKGAGLFDRVKKTFSFVLSFNTGLMIIEAIAIGIFAPSIMALFRADDAEVIRIGAKALRLQCLSLVLMPWNTLGNQLMQSVGESGKSTFLASLRQGIYYIPIIFLLPMVMQADGILYAQPAADVLTAITVAPFLVWYFKKKLP